MEIKQLTALELKQAIETGGDLVLLDVREPFEFNYAHIPGSHSIPLGQLPGRVAELAADDDIVVICHHGIRSMRAANFLLQSGFQRVCNLQGGIDAWSLHCDNSLRRY